MRNKTKINQNWVNKIKTLYKVKIMPGINQRSSSITLEKRNFNGDLDEPHGGGGGGDTPQSGGLDVSGLRTHPGPEELEESRSRCNWVGHSKPWMIEFAVYVFAFIPCSSTKGSENDRKPTSKLMNNVAGLANILIKELKRPVRRRKWKRNST